MTQLDKAVVLVTGASGGFGEQLTQQLLQAGSRLILTDLDEAALRQRVEAIQHQVTTGEVLACLAVDLSTKEGCEILYHQVKALNIPIDILINNAGIALFGRISEIANEEWERLMQVNLLTPMRLSGLFAPDMIVRQKGHIVNISSLAGWCSLPGLTHYVASKFGLRGFSEGLFHEVKDYNVKVTVVHPSFSRTPILRCEQFGSLNKMSDEFMDHISTDPAKVIQATIKGILHNKLHVFPDAIAQNMHLLKRYFPQIVNWMSDLSVRKLNSIPNK